MLLVIVKPSACRKMKKTKKKNIYIYIYTNRVRDGPVAVVYKKRDNNSLIKSTRHYFTYDKIAG